MEPQMWRGLGVEWRRPRAGDVVVACALYYLLHLQPDIPELGAASVAISALRCIRYRGRGSRGSVNG